jgi:hypothetical protein
MELWKLMLNYSSEVNHFHRRAFMSKFSHEELMPPYLWKFGMKKTSGMKQGVNTSEYIKLLLIIFANN